MLLRFFSCSAEVRRLYGSHINGTGSIVIYGDDGTHGLGWLVAETGNCTIDVPVVNHSKITNGSAAQLVFNQSLTGSGRLVIAELQPNPSAVVQLRAGATFDGQVHNDGTLEIHGAQPVYFRGGMTGGGALEVGGPVWIDSAAQAGTVTLLGAEPVLHVSHDFALDELLVNAGGRVQQTAGTTVVPTPLLDANAMGTILPTQYTMSGTAELQTGSATIGGEFLQSGGTHVAQQITIGMRDSVYFTDVPGIYEICRGRLEVCDLTIGVPEKPNPFSPRIPYPPVPGTLSITDAQARVVISESLTINELGTIDAPRGTIIELTGTDFFNHSTNPENLADLAHIALFFPGHADDADVFEVASLLTRGLLDNFAVGELHMAGRSHVLLIDEFNNTSSGLLSEECLLLQALDMEQDAVLDLGGIDLCVSGDVTKQRADLIIGGHIIDSTLPGEHINLSYDAVGDCTVLSFVPEPSSILLLSLGALGLLPLTHHGRGWPRRSPHI